MTSKSNQNEAKKVSKDISSDINEKLNKMIAYGNIAQQELKEHLYLIKKWLKEYNQFEYDNQSLGKFTKYIKNFLEYFMNIQH